MDMHDAAIEGSLLMISRLYIHDTVFEEINAVSMRTCISIHSSFLSISSRRRDSPPP